MNKSNTRLTALLIGIALATVGFSQTGPSPAQVKMTLLPTRVNVRVVLDGIVPASTTAAAYAAGNEAVLTVDLGSIQAPADAPMIPADEPPLVRAARFVPGTGGRVSLALTLQEKVPFRIFTEGTKTVIELIKVQRGSGEYLIAPETKAELDRTGRASRTLTLGAPNSRNDRLDFSAQMDGKAIVNIFALDAPLRLVVDVFDAVLERASFNVPVGSHGVDRIKVGQFKDGDPYAITRLVFELKEPRMFALSAGTGSFNVMFPDAAAVIAASPTPAAPKPAPKLESVTPLPAKTETKAAILPAEKKIEVKQPEAKPAGNGDAPPVKTETKTETA
ncbi:MAG: AMIN domain-containing protein, partial [Candidatus Aminicenantes bacterium]|nr:AMIN domain-containing protein [Candidatus Aminicenantes bacterium]